MESNAGAAPTIGIFNKSPSQVKDRSDWGKNSNTNEMIIAQGGAAWSASGNTQGLIQLGPDSENHSPVHCSDSRSTAGENNCTATAKFGGGGSGDVPTVLYLSRTDCACPPIVADGRMRMEEPA